MLCRSTTGAHPVRSRDCAFLWSLSSALWTALLYKAALHPLRGRDGADPRAEGVSCSAWVWKCGDSADVSRNKGGPPCLPWRDHTARRGGRYCPQTSGQLWNQTLGLIHTAQHWKEQQVQRHGKWDHFHHLNGFLVPNWTQSVFWLGKLWRQQEVIFSIFGPRSYEIA